MISTNTVHLRQEGTPQRVTVLTTNKNKPKPSPYAPDPDAPIRPATKVNGRMLQTMSREGVKAREKADKAPAAVVQTRTKVERPVRGGRRAKKA